MFVKNQCPRNSHFFPLQTLWPWHLTLSFTDDLSFSTKEGLLPRGIYYVKYESSFTYHSKVMANVKILQTNKQNGRTNRQAKTYMPQGGIKMWAVYSNKNLPCFVKWGCSCICQAYRPISTCEVNTGPLESELSVICKSSGINPLQNYKFLDWSKLKACTKDKINVIEKFKFLREG